MGGKFKAVALSCRRTMARSTLKISSTDANVAMVFQIYQADFASAWPPVKWT
jgi:hypothetical protein